MCVNLTGTFFLKTSLQKTQALSKFSVAFLMKSASSQDERWDIPFEAFLRPDAGQLNQMYSSNRQEQKMNFKFNLKNSFKVFLKNWKTSCIPEFSTW